MKLFALCLFAVLLSGCSFTFTGSFVDRENQTFSAGITLTRPTGFAK